MTGPELAAWRAEHGLTQAQLGARLGVDSNTVARWERGERAIPPYLPLALEGLAARLTPVLAIPPRSA